LILFKKVVTLRYRLINALLETEFLSKVYIKQANDLGFDQFHLYTRYLQFEFARFKEMTHTQPPIVVTELAMEDYKVDRYLVFVPKSGSILRANRFLIVV
jgi:hypothetical protein